VDISYLHSPIWDDLCLAITPSFIPMLFTLDESFRNISTHWKYQGKFSRAISDGDGNTALAIEQILTKFSTVGLGTSTLAKVFVPDSEVSSLLNSVRELSRLFLSPGEDWSDETTLYKFSGYVFLHYFCIPSLPKKLFCVMVVPKLGSNVLSLPTPYFIDKLHDMIQSIVLPLSSPSEYDIHFKNSNVVFQSSSIIENFQSLVQSSLSELAKCTVQALLKLQLADGKYKIPGDW